VDFPDERPKLMNLDFQKFQLRVHMYQCRNLPAADANGLSDPYVKARHLSQFMASNPLLAVSLNTSVNRRADQDRW